MKYDIKKEAGFKASKKPKIFVSDEQNILAIDGQGNPNSQAFQNDVEALYSIAFPLKMNFKKARLVGEVDSDIDDYVVPPLQGYWTISKEAQIRGSWSKDDLVYRLEIVIPRQVPLDFINSTMAEVRLKAKNKRSVQVYLTKIPIQQVGHILHVGLYDDESDSFNVLEQYLHKEGYQRSSLDHREIYLGDPRKSRPESLRTLLEVKIESK